MKLSDNIRGMNRVCMKWYVRRAKYARRDIESHGKALINAIHNQSNKLLHDNNLAVKLNSFYAIRRETNWNL